MLETVEVLSGARRALRRAVDIECQVIGPDARAPTAMRATNLSPFGVWIEVDEPFALGAPVVLTFVPPHGAEPMYACGEVRRTLAPGDASAPAAVLPPRARSPRAGMGIAFEQVESGARQVLERCLSGLPPELPHAPPVAAPEGATLTGLGLPIEVVWVDEL
ncbi:MAG: PilZ domain-containing protein [Myxococcales bacterium]|nr:PilZ domain-containing protein [Myxococcales bacterium]